MSKDKIILFTHADQFQQRQLNLSYIDIERSLKNTILLFGKVTLPGSSVLKSDATYKAVLNAKDLLKKGLIVPDLRDEYKSFGDYVERNKKHFRNRRLIQERASFLDKNTKNIITFPAYQISNCLENNLISALFYLKLNNQLRITWSDFSSFVTLIKRAGVSDRAIFLKKLDEIAKPKRIVLSTTQALYHTLGAFITGSHPIWPQLYSDTFEKIRIAQQGSEYKIKQSKEAAVFIDKYRFITPVQQNNAVAHKKIYEEGLNELRNISFVNNEVLDALDWSDIIELSARREAIYVRKSLFKKNALSDHIDLKSFLESEKKAKNRFSKVGKGIALSSLITGSVGCMDGSAIGRSGMILSIAGLLLTLGDMLIRSEVQKRLTSYSILGEQVTNRALENRVTDRLVHF